MDAGNELTIVNVEELPSRAWILDLSVAAEPKPAAADAEVQRLRAEMERMRVKQAAALAERDAAVAAAERRGREDAVARQATALARLVDMGFERAACVRELEVSRGSVDRALARLITQQEEEEQLQRQRREQEQDQRRREQQARAAHHGDRSGRQASF